MNNQELAQEIIKAIESGQIARIFLDVAKRCIDFRVRAIKAQDWDETNFWSENQALFETTADMNQRIQESREIKYEDGKNGS